MNLTEENKKKVNRQFAKAVRTKCYRKALALVSKYKIKGVTLSQNGIKELFGLKNKDFGKLNFIEIDNPHYKCAGNMKLYLIQEVEDKFNND